MQLVLGYVFLMGREANSEIFRGWVTSIVIYRPWYWTNAVPCLRGIGKGAKIGVKNWGGGCSAGLVG